MHVRVCYIDTYMNLTTDLHIYSEMFIRVVHINLQVVLATIYMYILYIANKTQIFESANYL